MNILFTICGRAGSKGFRNKNLKMLKGIPLVYYALSVVNLYQSKHTGDNVYVALNTDSEELIELVQQQKLIQDVLVVKREEKLAGDAVPKVAVIQSTYQKCQTIAKFDVVVDLDITSPMRRLCDVENAINTLQRNEKVDVVFSVVPARRSPYFNMVERQGDYYQKICKSDYTARQQAPEAYELNASIYAYNPHFLESVISKTLLEYHCDVSVMTDYLVLDIDSEEDFELLDKMFEIFAKRDSRLSEVVDNVEAYYLQKR